MSISTSITTWDVIQDLGFTADPMVVFSDVRPGLSYNFGNLKLEAACVTNMHVVPVVFLSGVLASVRCLRDIQFQLHRIVESREQCVAMIVWNLDQGEPGGVFQPLHEVPWLQEGRDHKHLLPWEREQEEYQARPHCTAEREWLKLAIKSLKRSLEQVQDTEPVMVGFDGKTLSIQVAGNHVALPA